MKKSLALLAGASMMVLGVPSVSLAQATPASGPFADVPADHWAYQSVDNLQKAGIVIGYPDGTYGGKRAMTRYEFAVAIARLLPLIQNNDYATKSDLAALRSDLEARLAANQTAIDDLRRLVNEFQGELQALGQDVAAIKTRLNALEGRVAAVEEEQRRIRFTGDLNLIARADVARKKFPNSNNVYKPFVDKNGTTTGRSYTRRLLEASDVYHDFLLGVKGKVSDTATVNVKADFQNFLNAIGNIAYIPPTGNITPGNLTSGAHDTFLYEANLQAPVGLGPLGGAELTIGRFGQQYTKYTFKLVDADYYTNLYQTDSGNTPVDGGSLSLKLGPVNVNGFAAKMTAIPFSQPYGGSTVVGGASNGGFSGGGYPGFPGFPGIPGFPGVPGFPGGGGFATSQTRPTGEIDANHARSLAQGAGFRATIGSPESAVIGATVEQFGLSSAATDPERVGNNGARAQYDKLTVYGVDFNGVLPFFKSLGLTFDGAYTVSAHALGSGFNGVGSGFRYSSHEEQVGFTVAGVSIKGGYQYVGPYFSAPGDWGKLGAWQNPTNVQGPVLSAKYALTHSLALKADAQFYKAAYGNAGNGSLINSPLQDRDHVTRYQIGLGYGLTSSNAVDLGYERVRYDLRNNNGTLFGAGKPKENYINIGIGHTFNPNASFKLLYQIVNYRDRGTGFGVNAANAAADADGSVAVGQFSLKF